MHENRTIPESTPAPQSPLKGPAIIGLCALIVGVGGYILIKKRAASSSAAAAAPTVTAPTTLSAAPPIPVYMLVGNTGGSQASGGSVAGDNIGNPYSGNWGFPLPPPTSTSWGNPTPIVGLQPGGVMRPVVASGSVA